MVEDYTSYSSFDQLKSQCTICITIICFYSDVCMKINLLFVVSNDYFISRIECFSFSFYDFVSYCFLALCDVIQTKNHVLRRKGDWRTILRVQNVVRRKHQQLSFQNSSVAQRHVNRHLISIEIRVECRSYQWVKMNRFTFNQFWLECLD